MPQPPIGADVTELMPQIGADVSALMASAEPAPEQSSGRATAAVTGLRTLGPKVARGMARFAANHPAATQKTIGAGITTAASGIGAGIGGIPGAVVGASIRGVTPAQTTIRQAAGRLAGESPRIAQEAARALGIQNYAKETTGVRVKPSDIIPKPNTANALEAYANANERGILRLYDPYGQVVSGPEAIARQTPPPKPSFLKTAARAAGPFLARLSGATGVTDFAQTVEPARQDIGIAGVGFNEPRSDAERAAHPALLNALAAKARAALLALMQDQP